MEKALLPVLQGLAATLLAQDWRLVTAESCTGGWIAKTCTDMAGSSRWFECGFVSYSNRSKQ
ncbi:MAG: CinA family protein, partial [Thiothrix sp.]|nr:CinA family protein [Thiothrix sp.]